jgi:hypothetical protein
MAISKSKYRTSEGARRPSDWGDVSRRERSHYQHHLNRRGSLTRTVNMINDIRYYNKIQFLFDPLKGGGKDNLEIKYDVCKEDHEFGGIAYGRIGGIKVVIEVTKEGNGYLSVKSNQKCLKKVYSKVLDRIIAGNIALD